jgi:hypothetical protein
MGDKKGGIGGCLEMRIWGWEAANLSRLPAADTRAVVCC